jgi:hypothetical protein
MFEYMVDHYEFKAPETSLTKHFKEDIANFQYKHLTGEVNPNKTKFENSTQAGKVITKFSKEMGANLVGFTKVQDHFIFQGNDIGQKYAVVLGMEMNYDEIATAPEAPSGIEVLRTYWLLGHVLIKVGNFIRSIGYQAVCHHPRSFVGAPPTVLHTAAAYEAGLGEIGRMGLLITKEYGPRVRVATITTDLELPQGTQKTFGVEEYCKTCTVCRDVCDGDAIPDEKGEVRGFKKYTIDPYKCLPYFAKYDGCNNCVARCPFNKRPDELKKFLKDIK